MGVYICLCSCKYWAEQVPEFWKVEVNGFHLTLLKKKKKRRRKRKKKKKLHKLLICLHYSNLFCNYLNLGGGHNSL